MAGYANRVIKLTFDELADDPANDPIWVIIRNPRLMPAAEITSLSEGSGYEVGEDGTPQVADKAKAMETMGRMAARLVIAARVYDPSSPGEIDPETGEMLGEQPRLPAPPWDASVAAKLPMEIMLRISREFAEAVNPQKGQEPTTPNGSSGQPSPSSEAPGTGSGAESQLPLS